MKNNKDFTIDIVTYLAQLGVTSGTTGMCRVMARTAFGKTKLGRAFVLVTSVCAGVCTAYGLKDILHNGAEYSINAFADGWKALKDTIEFRNEDAQKDETI